MSNNNNTNLQPYANDDIEYEFDEKTDSKKERLIDKDDKQRMKSVSDTFSINDEKNKQQAQPKQPQFIQSY